MPMFYFLGQCHGIFIRWSDKQRKLIIKVSSNNKTYQEAELTFECKIDIKHLIDVFRQKRKF